MYTIVVFQYQSYFGKKGGTRERKTELTWKACSRKDGVSGGLWLKMEENLLLTVGTLLTVLATEPWSSLSNGLRGREERKD